MQGLSKAVEYRPAPFEVREMDRCRDRAQHRSKECRRLTPTLLFPMCSPAIVLNMNDWLS